MKVGARIRSFSRQTGAPTFVFAEVASRSRELVERYLSLFPLHKVNVLSYLANGGQLEGARLVSYTPRSVDGGGRIYAVSGGLQLLPKKLRLLMFGKGHYEVDMIGAFYEIVRREVAKEDLSAPSLPPIGDLRSRLQNALATFGRHDLDLVKNYYCYYSSCTTITTATTATTTTTTTTTITNTTQPPNRSEAVLAAPLFPALKAFPQVFLLIEKTNAKHNEPHRTGRVVGGAWSFPTAGNSIDPNHLGYSSPPSSAGTPHVPRLRKAANYPCRIGRIWVPKSTHSCSGVLQNVSEMTDFPKFGCVSSARSAALSANWRRAVKQSLHRVQS